MTPKESFQRFLSQSQGSYLSPWEIWKEATRQAYENALTIADILYDEGDGRAQLTYTVEAIRAKVKEYDNE